MHEGINSGKMLVLGGVFLIVLCIADALPVPSLISTGKANSEHRTAREDPGDCEALFG